MILQYFKKKENEYKIKSDKIYFNILNHPEYLNIRCLPKDLKINVEKNLQPYLLLPRVKGIIDYMWAEDWSDKLPQFVKYTKELDASRNESIKDVVPELANV